MELADAMNALENIIKDRFKLTTVKMEHLRSSTFYEVALDLTFRQEWSELEAVLRRIQIITTRTDMRHTKRTS